MRLLNIALGLVLAYVLGWHHRETSEIVQEITRDMRSAFK